MNIFESIEKGNLTKVKKLVESGVDINLKNANGNTSLHYACLYGYLDIVKYLVESGIDINLRNDIDEYTPLHIACINGYLDIVKELIESGADINLQNEYENTPLYFSRIYGKLDIIEYLENRIKYKHRKEVINKILK